MRRSGRRDLRHKLRQVDEDEGMVREARDRDQSHSRCQRRAQQGDDVGVIIVVKRAGGGMPGSIEKPSCCIWIQRKMRRRGSGSREAGGGQGKGRGND